MDHTTHIGTNRTGMKSSPRDAGALLEVSEPVPEPLPATATPFAAMKMDYGREAEALGSVPPPASLRGALTSARDMITGKRPQVVFDKIAERLAFERSGVRLYEALILKHQVDDTAAAAVPLEQLQEFHDQELDHFRMLVEAMEQLGGDPTAQTPCATVAGMQAMGLVQVVNEPRTTFAQSLQAILIAELADVDGWRMLIDVVTSAGHRDLAERFERAAQEEDRHLAHVRQWLQLLVRAELGVS